MTDHVNKKTKLPPTLIIGLGGKGCDVVRRVHDMTNEAQRKFIRFVFIDTDANELRQHKLEAPDAYTVQTSRTMTAGQALRVDPEARLHTFPINQQILNKPMTEGAGQIRALSKLAFDAALREGRVQELHDAVNSLLPLTGEETNQAMRVMIVATICGGTGSGLFLPLSMYLRHYLETNRQQKAVIRGFCMLPGIFSCNPVMNDTEIENLRVNAYAALREIDAFMLRSDSAQSKEMQSRFRLMMPRSGTVDQYDEYSDNPLDFCFLFDGQNMDGSSLDTMKEYVQHAADCIYAASVSKLNKRLNSSEDNTVLSRIRTSGRNRYCGIGTSKIVYPFEDIKEYIALSWMKEATTDEWMKYDNAAKKEAAKRSALRAAGVSQAELDERDFYCRKVESDKEQHDHFSTEIMEECYNKDEDGIFMTTPRWDSYYEKITKLVQRKIDESTSSSNNYAKTINKKINGTKANLNASIDDGDLGNFSTQFHEYEQNLKGFYSVTRRTAENTAGILAGSLFSPENYDPNNEEHIEHWLMRHDGTPIHPNSVRYFLYNLRQLLEKELQTLIAPPKEDNTGTGISSKSKSLPELEKSINDFFNADSYTITHGRNDREKVRIANYVAETLCGPDYDSVFKKKKWRLAAREVMNKCNRHYEEVKKYYGVYMHVAVLTKAIEFVGQLSAKYELFYNYLKTEITHIPREMQKIEETYEDRSGSPIKYACATKTCLDYLVRECTNTIGTFKLTNEFRKKIFNTLYGCLSISENKQSTAIRKLVSEDIIEFWSGEVMSKYSSIIDIDIVSAICLQNEIENDTDAEDFDQQKFNLEKIKREAFKLASPFIDKPSGRTPHIISAYGTGIDAFSTDDTTKAMLYSKVLDQTEKDELMDKYQLMFMNAVYDLSVKDLYKFAPSDNLDVDPVVNGVYFKAYRARIEHVLPDSRKTSEMTPHLDKTWHYIGVLPDLDDRVEEMDIADAQRAFFYSVVMNEYIHMDNERKYVFLDENREPIKDEIDVGDGKCDKFHEIYEAMLRSRPLINEIIGRFNALKSKEINEKGIGSRTFRDTELYKNMTAQVKSDYPLHYSDSVKFVSYLEIPLLYKASTGNSSFDDRIAMTMFDNMTKEIESYLAGFYSNDKSVLNEYFVTWFGEQALLMLNNVSSYYAATKEDGSITVTANPLRDPLFKNLANAIIARFKRYEYCDEAREWCEKFISEYERITAEG